MAVSSPCVAAGDLERIRLGQCSQEELACVSAHVRQCSICLARVQALKSPADADTNTLLSALLEASGSALPPLPSPAGQAKVRAPAGRHEETLPERIGRYPIVGLIGRGGMGVVYRGRDESLQRGLAIKVLLSEHAEDAELQQRFVKEAQIMGQLQHPGVAPIHEIGTLDDGRPFFSMKQIHGQTLAALLKRRSPADLTTHIGIFAHVCQTVAYAHAQRIIHRDLKPDNIMVGAFGEVQVMDWGLAKVLSAPEAAGDSAYRSTAPKPVSAGGTVPGTVMGTPAYIPPEQARGELDRLDVFGLGAVLCEILTGQPPYRGANLMELLEQVATTDLSDAHARLARCGADGELVDLCRRCLAPAPAARPGSAAAVAEAVATYQAQVQQRLQEAQAARAAALVKAAEERKRRRVSVALLAVVLLFGVALSAAGLWYIEDQAQRAEEEAQLAEKEAQRSAQAAQEETEVKFRNRYVHKEVAVWLDVADKHLEDIAYHLADPLRTAVLLSNPEERWKGRIDLARQARHQALSIAGAGRVRLDPALQKRVADLETALATADTLWQIGGTLEQLRWHSASSVNGKFKKAQVTPKYQSFFAKQFQIDFLRDNPETIARLFIGNPLRYVLVAALDHWAESVHTSQLLPERLLATARLVDPDAWRDQVRDPQVWQSPAKLRALAQDPKALQQSPQVLLLLAARLPTPDDFQLLSRVSFLHPQEFWYHFQLGMLASHPAEQVGYFWTASILRPKSAPAYSELGVALKNRGNLNGAIDAYHKAIACDPKFGDAHFNLGIALRDKGDLDGAIDAYRQAIACDPEQSDAYINLGGALQDKGNLDGAITVYRQAIDWNPHDAMVHYNLGLALNDKGDVDGAIAAYRNALDCNPKYAKAHYNLGLALNDKGDVDGAIAAYRAALLIADGKDVKAKVPVPEAAALRHQAQQWLLAELELIRKDAQSNQPATRKNARADLIHWKVDADLVSIRNAAALKELPAAERQQWQQFWTEVDQLLDQLSKPPKG